MILLSVNPPYACLLVDGEKRIEWRKRMLPCGKAAVYETKKNGGCGMIIGYVWIGGKLQTGVFENVDKIPDGVLKAGCLSKDDLNKYKGKGVLFANVTFAFERIPIPLKLSEIGVKRAPQSWCYVVGV